MVDLSLYMYTYTYACKPEYIHALLTQVHICMHLLPFSLHMYTKYQECYSVLHDHQPFILECISLNLQ